MTMRKFKGMKMRRMDWKEIKMIRINWKNTDEKEGLERMRKRKMDWKWKGWEEWNRKNEDEKDELKRKWKEWGWEGWIEENGRMRRMDWKNEDEKDGLDWDKKVEFKKVKKVVSNKNYDYSSLVIWCHMFCVKHSVISACSIH